MRAVCGWYDVNATIASPPLRAPMSGAVSRRVVFCTDTSVPKRRRCEGRNANHDRMENKAERQIDYGADDDGDDVVLDAAQRNWRRTGIVAALERDAIIHRPGQCRSEQEDTAEIAVGAEMGEAPGFYPGKHRVLEHAFDISGNVGRRDHDAGR